MTEINNKKGFLIGLSLVTIFLVSQLLITAGVDLNQKAHAGESFGLIADSMMLEDQSKYDFEETVERFKEEVDNAGWGILNYHDMQAVKEGHGFEVREVKVFDLCSAEYSAEILELDDERIVTPLMPCRVSIYKKSNGNTYIGRMNSPLMARFFGGTINDVMQVASAETEEIIDQLIVDERERGNSAFDLVAGVNYLVEDETLGFHLGKRTNLTRTFALTSTYERFDELNGLNFGAEYNIFTVDAADINFYAKAGLGYYFADDVNNTFGANLGTSAEFSLLSNLDLVTGLNYRRFDLRESDSDDIDINLGVSYTF